MDGNLKTWMFADHRKVDTALTSLLNALGPEGDAVISLMYNDREYVKLVATFMLLAAKTPSEQTHS